MGKLPKHITITGDLGSGKSSMAARLTDKYGATRISTGAVQRELAANNQRLIGGARRNEVYA